MVCLKSLEADVNCAKVKYKKTESAYEKASKAFEQASKEMLLVPNALNQQIAFDTLEALFVLGAQHDQDLVAWQVLKDELTELQKANEQENAKTLSFVSEFFAAQEGVLLPSVILRNGDRLVWDRGEFENWGTWHFEKRKNEGESISQRGET